MTWQALLAKQIINDRLSEGKVPHAHYYYTARAEARSARTAGRARRIERLTSLAHLVWGRSRSMPARPGSKAA